MPRPTTLTVEGRAEIERVAIERIKTPTDKELAHRHGVSRSYVQLLMAEVRRRLKDAIQTNCNKS